jgi:hypothetical protein
MWRCQCDCGRVKAISRNDLRSGRTLSCGCLAREILIKRATVHGLASKTSGSSVYSKWHDMLSRCYNAGNKQYADYGGRGIDVCPRWRFGEGGKSGVECYAADIGDQPSDSHTLDRIDNNVGYYPDNIRWATRLQQNRNRRSIIYLDYQGRTMILRDALKASGSDPSRYYDFRARTGLPPQLAFNLMLETPKHSSKVSVIKERTGRPGRPRVDRHIKAEQP